MRIRAAITKVCILAVLAFYATAGAEIKIKSVDVSPYIGSYFFEKNMCIDLDHGMMLGGRLGYNITENWGIEATGGYMNTETKNPFMTPYGWLLEKDSNVDFWLFHLDAIYHLTPMEQVTPYLAFGGGAYNIDPAGFDSDIDPLFNYGLGIKYFFADWIAFRVDCRHLIAIDELDNFEDPGKNLHNNLSFDAGLTLSLWGKGLDDDQDGVNNKLDKCPNTPKGVKVDADGCPIDTDGDGVADYLDKCPDTPKGVKVDANGCPVDTDGDGVPDYLDKCPNTPSGVKVDKNGCPVDTDGDSIADYLDKCPNEAEDKDGFQDEDGCPEPDNDGDGILDGNDKCPDKAETFNGFEDEDGCPDAVILKKDDVINIDNIYFQSGKADLVASSFPVLDSVKRIFVDNPGIVIRIEGHTDSQGAAAYNKNLSQKRAETVLNYLTKNLGIPKEQLTALGYGEERPVADNKTKEGQAKNRRIEFRVMK